MIDLHMPDDAVDFKKVIGQNLRTLRRAAQLTQDQLADQLPHPITRKRIGDWETGRYKPNDRYLTLLADALAVDVYDFYRHPAES